MSERKTRKHPKYSIEQKNEIVRKYLDKALSQSNIVRQFDIHHSTLQKWVKQYRGCGTTFDNRGKASKKGLPNIGRSKKIDFESMTKEELISYIKVGEEIKKAVAYLRKQKKNIKS